MSGNNTTKLLVGGLVIFLIGMGSTWLVLRKPASQAAEVVDDAQAAKPTRFVNKTETEKEPPTRPVVLNEKPEAQPRRPEYDVDRWSDGRGRRPTAPHPVPKKVDEKLRPGA